MVRIPFHPRYIENRDRCGVAYPCVVCGKGIVKPRYMVHVHNGGLDLVTEDEAAQLSEAADLGWNPLGRDCYRKHPELHPYVTQVQPSDN